VVAEIAVVEGFEILARNAATMVFEVVAAVSPRERSVVPVLDQVLVQTLVQLPAPLGAASPYMSAMVRSPGYPFCCSCQTIRQCHSFPQTWSLRNSLHLDVCCCVCSRRTARLLKRIVWSCPLPLLFLPCGLLLSPHAEGGHQRLETCRRLQYGATIVASRRGGSSLDNTSFLRIFRNTYHILGHLIHGNDSQSRQLGRLVCSSLMIIAQCWVS
jgi:hypothetical protein